jgi:hypothetical protein
VLLTGNLHDPNTRPHSNGKSLEPFEMPDFGPETEIPVSLTHGQRKLVANYCPHLRSRMEVKKTGRREVHLNLIDIKTISETAHHLARQSSGAELRIARDLADELEDIVEGVTALLERFFAEHSDREPVLPWVEESRDILLRCALEGEAEPVRWIKVPTDYSLGELHHILQIVFGWENSHLYEFQIAGGSFSHPDSPMENVQSDEIEVGEVFARAQRGVYRYDFGDSWELSLEVLRGYEWGDNLPCLVAATGPSLVEDCGGVWGFQELLKVLRHPEVDDPNDLRDWVDQNYDPWKPDLEESQRRLREVFLDDPDEDEREYLVKRYPTQGIKVAGEATDVLLIVDKRSGYVIEGSPILRSDGDDKLLGLIRAGLQKAPEPGGLAVEDESLARLLREHLPFKVRVRRSLPELDVAGREMEVSLMEFPYSFDHLTQEAIEEFLTFANDYYLNPPWVEVSDDELFLVEGLAPGPLALNVLGNAGVQHGLVVFEDLQEARALFQKDAPRPKTFFFLNFLENWEGASLRTELSQRGLNPLPDMVPFVLTQTSISQERNFRLITESLKLVKAFDRKGQKAQTFAGPGGAGEVKVTWPVLPDELEELAQKLDTKPDTKLGRNDPCWCGSGKKYKKCHLGKD